MRIQTLAASLALAATTVLLSCSRTSDTAAAPDGATDTGTGSQENAVFHKGFYKEEATPSGNLRWAHQTAAVTLSVPTAGTYRLTFKPITIFTPPPTSIEVSVNGKPVGTVTAQSFDIATAPASSVEAPLQAGANEITLKANKEDARLTSTDTRTAAFGLILPIEAEPLP
ncbi:hypothetical protein BH20VER1_BH20VER1_18800 [soil metagenome]